MPNRLKSISKFLSHVLRHRPDVIGLQLDNEGWANIDDLARLAAAHGRSLSRGLIAEVARTSEKQRFALKDDGNFIRANQGHSIEVDLHLPPANPPAVLFHGTATRFVCSIRSTGLIPGSRQYVHFSTSESAAVEVGKRHGKPIVLAIDASAMHKDGHIFWRSENGVWLTRMVPPRYLVFPEED